MKNKLLFFVFVFSVIISAQNKTNVQTNKYFSTQKLTLNGGASIEKTVISGPPTPPVGITRSTVMLPLPNKLGAVNTLLEVPAFDWSFGCSATSAAMIAGYYDRHGYDNMYTGPTNSGVMPLDNSSWPSVTINGEIRKQCPLSATRNGLDGRAINGHVDDYWILYGSTDPDPFITNGWVEHTYGDCTGDYMKTNQSNFTNTDGSTTFYNYNDGSPLHTEAMVSGGIQNKDGGYGLKLFFESRGYTVTELFNQYINGYNGNTIGFTFEQFKSEIDAGRPVIINVTGHTMVGIGYDDASNLIYIHDTWDYSTHTMTWGGSYSGMQQYAVTVVHLAESEIDVTGNTNSIPDGDITPALADYTDFGNVGVGNTVSHTFTIKNTGAYVLKLNGSPIVQISGSSDFTVSAQPSVISLASGESTTFTVQYTPTSSGTQTAAISIVNTDLNEYPYNFDIKGVGHPLVTFEDGSGLLQSITPNSTDQVIGSFQLSASLGGATLSGVSIKLNGIRSGLSNLKLWSSADNIFSSESDTQIGSTVAVDPGNGNSVSFSSLSGSISTDGSYYFLTGDISSDANGTVQGVIVNNNSLTLSTGLLDGTINNAILSSDTSPLPVELTSFSAKVNGSMVELIWQTATEVNNYGFEVERQITSKQNTIDSWEKLGFVEGSGNSSSPKEYSFIDANPVVMHLGTGTETNGMFLQYRLKQIDNDGRYKYYTNIAEANLSTTGMNEKQLPTEFALEQNYPNPFNPTTVISYQIPIGTSHNVFVELCVYDILGNKVATLVNEEKAPGYYQVNLNAENLSTGIYMYSISAGNFSSTKKLLLLK